MNLIKMEYGGKNVRIVEIEGKPHFVGKDVAECLGYAQPDAGEIIN